MVIAIGIACMVGMLTAIDCILYSMSSNFNRLGANSFSFKQSRQTIKSSNRGRKIKRGEPIRFDDAIDFKDAFKYGSALVSIDAYCTGGATVKYDKKETNPTVKIIGIDENYFLTSAYEVEEGRNFTSSEALSGTNKVIIGNDLVNTLFDKKAEKALGQLISINGSKYKVIGTLKQKGSSAGSGNDRKIYISLLNAKKLYGYAQKNYNITVSTPNSTDVDDTVSSAIGTMRNIRKLKAAEENDFDIRKSDGMLEKLKDMTSTIRLGTMIIAGLTLLGAAIGLMNIMLVSVTERTKEIGVRKALGATKINILAQFLSEAIVICIIGGIVGIIFGILIGFGVTLLISGQFVIPWNWMTLGIIVCIIVGVVSGIFPAIKASNLDPIDALRWE